jgi:glyoxylase I family protein
VALRIEHIAFEVPEPVAFAAWYVEHLGCTVVRAYPEEPFAHFVRLPGDGVMLEVYRAASARDSEDAARHPLTLHVAFAVDELETTCEALLAAGAQLSGEPIHTLDGDDLIMLRDPWGLPIQLARRSEPMV